MHRENLLTDNPELYEARFPDTERLAGRWAEDCLHRHHSGSRVLDLGCGTGRDAAHLHRAGRTVVGADLSAAMLAHARTHHPGPDYVHADLRDFDLPQGPFDAVVCLDSALLYCHTNAELDGFLSSCRRGLTLAGCSWPRCATAPSSSAVRNCSTPRPSTTSPGTAPPTPPPPRCPSTAPPNSCAAPASGPPTTAPRPTSSVPHGGCSSPKNCGTPWPRTASRSSTCTTGRGRAPTRPGTRAPHRAPADGDRLHLVARLTRHD